jgi:hypothetical protein
MGELVFRVVADMEERINAIRRAVSVWPEAQVDVDLSFGQAYVTITADRSLHPLIELVVSEDLVHRAE